MSMKIEVVGTTNNFTDVEDMKKFCYRMGRLCYSKKEFSEIMKEPINEKLMNDMIKSGHHSIFEHGVINFYFSGIPKILAMVLNNEKQYATSEKSARYTVMSDIDPKQKELYDKWMNIFKPEINAIYPQMPDVDKRNENIRKLAQENARYVTSIFTPTKMGHSINLRQLNYIISEFEDSYERNKEGKNHFQKRITQEMLEFVDQVKEWKVEGLQNQTDRHLSLFDFSKIDTEKYFGDVYSTAYNISLAGLAQAHRHRTINYNINCGIEMGAPRGFFIPKIIRHNNKLSLEWIKDLEEIARTDYPQAQLVSVVERGIVEDFRSKALLRMCGHPQHEIMENTHETAKEYNFYQEKYGDKSLEPKCQQGIPCESPCVWGGKKALTRLI